MQEIKNIIAELAGQDPFFAAADEKQQQTLEAYVKFGVWSGGPHMVVIPGKNGDDIAFNQKIAQFMGDEGESFPPTHVCSGLLVREMKPDNRPDLTHTRLFYAFSSPEAAAFFSRALAEKFGVASRTYEVADAGPDQRVFIPHSQSPDTPSPDGP